MTIRELEEKINIEGYVRIITYHQESGEGDILCEVEDWNFTKSEKEKYLDREIAYMYPTTEIKDGVYVGVVVLEVI